MNEQDSQSIIEIGNNLKDLANEQAILNQQFKEGLEKDKAFWEECRNRSIQLTKNKYD